MCQVFLIHEMALSSSCKNRKKAHILSLSFYILYLYNFMDHSNLRAWPLFLIHQRIFKILGRFNKFFNPNRLATKNII